MGVFDDDLSHWDDKDFHSGNGKRRGKAKAGSRGKDDFWDSGQGNFFSGKKCHEEHPELKIGGGTLLGGNCRDHQRHEAVQFYVALDGSQQHPHFDPSMDFWAQPVSVYYPIQNMGIPNNPKNFAALIDMIVDQLAAGARVHVGCIGGHGRTGMVLAAVVAVLGIAEDNDAIGWVRKHYCKKAVESKSQEGFLATHFGCKLPRSKSSVDKRHSGF